MRPKKISFQITKDKPDTGTHKITYFPINLFVDIDECSRKDLFRCGRDAKCTNTDGAYKCECTGDKPEGDPKRRCFGK